MTCPWRDQLDRYLDAELSETELSQVQAHLRECPACAAEALDRMQLKRSVRAAGRAFTARPEFRLKVERAIGGRRAPRTWAWIPRVAVPVAALALVLTAAGLWLQRAPRARTIDELADIHLSTLASPNPVDVLSSDKHTVKPWFAGRLPFTFNLPDLQGSRFQLVGGRVVYLEQTPGAQLLLEAGKHRVSVFVFADQAAFSALRPGSSTTRSHFNVETWTERGLRFLAVSDAEPSAVRELSERFKSADAP